MVTRSGLLAALIIVLAAQLARGESKGSLRQPQPVTAVPCDERVLRLRFPAGGAPW